MNPLTLCLAASLGLHGLLWQWGHTARDSTPRIQTRQGEIAVELNLMPTPAAPPPAPTPAATKPVTPPAPVAHPEQEPIIPIEPDVQPPTEPTSPEPEPETIPPTEPEPETTLEPDDPPDTTTPPAPVLNAAPEPLGIERIAEPSLKAAPIYPRLSRRRGEEGIVVITLTVTAQGHAENIAIKQSSGYPLLDKAALKAIQRSQFTPAQRNGAAITSTLEQTIEFKLEH